MPYLNRDGVNIYYEERGKGPAVLLSHGYSASARMWDGQMEALSDRYHLIAWDMRGHDRSDSPNNPALYSHEATVADMAAILDACGARRAVIGGLSLGGYMSLAFNLAHPERVAALMLFDTGPGYKKDGPREEWNKMAGSDGEGAGDQGSRRGGRRARRRRSRIIAARKASRMRRAGCSRRRTAALSSRCHRSRCRRWCWRAPRMCSFSRPQITWRRKFPAPRK